MESVLNNLIFLPFLTAFLITAGATAFFLPILKRFGIVDDPKKRKHPAVIHKKPIPRGGGIPLFLGAFIAAIIFLPLNKIVGAIFLASFISLATGVLDDKYDISPYVRFVINIICAAIVVGAGISVPFITNPLGGILYLNEFRLSFEILGISAALVLSDLVAMLWIVWVMNMLNWSKGVDGQMPGIVAISAVFIGILSLRFGTLDSLTQTTTSLSFIVAGGALGFLIYNFHPAKIFPGYGATSIYLLLAVVSILSSAKLATAILVMGVPLADGAFTIGRRILTGHSPFWHDKKHLHHLLLSTGAGQRQIALFYWVISAIFGALSLVLSSRGKIFAIIMLIIIVGGTLLFLNYLIRKKNGTQSI
ncbi:MAG: undecaprenyl/decaprenyl-phosphate alpha-N-acetylglucosaminyl 1-phosphate transferase [Candidatus Levybacteria bacterium]|nr:undecaprenyl/decaprenyl-phosphate alpha-N-acetylglucosaminyl 1-phosphate transferase [Candidatus Levybacteria bacterium]